MLRRKTLKKEYYLLTILRAIAFFAISLFHGYSHMLPGGYLAVIIFLLLSGFLSERSQKKKSYSFKLFFRKFTNIMAPIYFIMSISMIIALFFAREIFDDSIKSVLPVAFNFENIRRIFAGDDYFNQSGNFNIFLHIWYISLYMQFIGIYYLINKLLAKSKNDSIKIIIYFVLTILSFVAIIHFGKSPKDITRIYYGIDTRFSAFGLGGLLALLSKNFNKNYFNKKSSFLVAISVLIFATLIPFFIISGRKISSYGLFFIVYTIITGLLVTALYEFEDRFLLDKNNYNILTKFLLYVGDRSYYFYLWQYVVQIFFIYFLANVFDNVFINIIVQFLIIIILGEITYKIFSGKKLKIRLFISTLIILIILNVISLAIGNKKKEDIANLKKEITQNEEEIKKRNEKAKLEAEKKKKDEIEEAKKADLEKQEKVKEEKIKKEEEFIEKAYDDFEFTDKEKEYLANISISAVGDSVILNADSYIRKFIPNFYLDGKVGRDMIDGPAVLQSIKNNVGLGDIVVMSLGSNGSANVSDMDKIMEIADGRDVYFVNTSHTQSYMDYVNEEIKKYCDKNDKAHLVDWRNFIKDKANYLAPDRTHPNIPGSDGFAKLIMRKILNVNKIQP